MSFRDMELVSRLPREGYGSLYGSDYLVLQAIAWHCSRETPGFCFPSVPTLAAWAHISERQVARCVLNLAKPMSAIDQRAILTTQKGGGRGRHTTYQINLELVRELSVNTDSKTVISEPETLTNEQTNTDKSVVETLTYEHLNTDICASLYRRTLLNQIQEPSTGTSEREARVYAEFKAMILSVVLTKGYKDKPGQEDFTEIVSKIALAHPRSQNVKRKLSQVKQGEVAAILFAMDETADERKTTMVEAGDYLLAKLQAWERIPREQWKFCPNIEDFYGRGSYQVEPEDLPGIGNNRSGGSNGNRSGVINDVNAAAREEYLRGSQESPGRDRDASAPSGGAVRPPANEDPARDLRGGARGTDGNAGHRGIQPGAGGRNQVLPFAGPVARALGKAAQG